MRILFIKSHIHIKNLNFILKCKNIHFTIIDWIDDFYKMDISSFDVVYSPCDLIDVSLYPNTKFIFGPHCCLFPHEKNLNLVKGNNSIYLQPSEWPINFWYYCDNSTKELNCLPFAFGVDTEKFVPTKPIIEREKVFIYFKHRNPLELKLVETFLNVKNYNYRIFSYQNRYSEEEYIEYLQNSKFGIWVGGHESQGFALEEALSSNVPLLVWSVKSMKQEYGSSYHDIPATTIPYWDERCGEYFHNPTEIEDTFDTFISKLETYKPREYIVDNLSIEKCEEKLIDIINTKYNSH